MRKFIYLVCGDVGGDGHEKTRSQLISITCNSISDFLMYIKNFELKYKIKFHNSFNDSKEIDAAKLEEFLDILQYQEILQECYRKKDSDKYEIGPDIYFAILIKIAMFMQPDLDIKIERDFEYVDCGGYELVSPY